MPMKVHSQSFGSASNVDVDITNADLLNHKEYSGFKGSPYLNDEYYPALVIKSDGTQFKLDEVRIDLFKNYILFKTGKEERLLDNGLINEVHLEDGNNTFLKVIQKNTENILVLLLVAGKYTLMKEYEVDLIVKDRSNATSYSGNTDVNQQEFKSVETFIWTNDFKTFYPVEKSKKEFLSGFKGVDGLSDFLNSEKLKPKKEEDLIQIFNYLNFNDK